MAGSSGGSGSYSGLRDLNALPLVDMDETDAFNADDLALFTNTRFFDFDCGSPSAERRVEEEGTEEDGGGQSLKGGNMDFLNDYDPYGYAPYPLHDLPHSSSTPAPAAALTITTSFIDAPSALISPHVSTAPSHHHTQPQPPSAPLSDSSSPTPSSSRGMRQRKASTASASDHITSPTSLDFSFPSDAAADEDKRRRNTAASARFRVKKKERELQLAKEAKDATEKVKELEARIKQLQMENTWLKDLLMEKKTAKEGAKDGVGTTKGN